MHKSNLDTISPHIWDHDIYFYFPFHRKLLSFYEVGLLTVFATVLKLGCVDAS